MAIAAELQDKFWAKRLSRNFSSFTRSARTDAHQALKGHRDDELCVLKLPLSWQHVDANGHVAPRLTLAKDIGTLVLGPGADYEICEAFNASGRFPRGACVEIKGREAWADSQATQTERTRPKTPQHLMTMNPTELHGAEGGKFSHKHSKIFKPTISLRVKETTFLGPGSYDDSRPFDKHMISTISRPGRTKFSPLPGSPIRRPVIPKNYFTEDSVRDNYDIAWPLGIGARAVFMPSEERGKAPHTTCSDLVGPGCYDVVTPLRAVSPPSKKAKWFTKYTFSKDAASAVPFSRTQKHAPPSKWSQFGDRQKK